MPDQNPATADYIVKTAVANGHLWPAIVAIVVGLPSTWKALGLIGRFFARRFDNRDELVQQFVQMQAREMDIRLEEAKSRQMIADALSKSAEAHQSAAEAQARSAGQFLELLGTQLRSR